MTLVDAKVAAVAANLTPRRIRQQVAEGKLTNYGPPRGKVLVDLWAVLDRQGAA